MEAEQNAHIQWSWDYSVTLKVSVAYRNVLACVLASWAATKDSLAPLKANHRVVGEDRTKRIAVLYFIDPVTQLTCLSTFCFASHV